MKTPMIMNAVIALQNSAPAAKQGTDVASAAQFNQVLSRQMNDRRDDSINKTAAQSKDNAAPSKPVAGPNKTSANPSGDKEKIKEKTDEAPDDSDKKTDALPTASIELMALVAQVAQANAKPADSDSSSSDQTEPDFAIDETMGKEGKQLLPLNSTDSLETALTAEAYSENGISANQLRDQNARHGNQKIQDVLPELTAAGKKQEILPDLQVAAKPQEALANLAMPPVQQVPLEVLQAVSGRPTEKLSPHVGTPAWDQALGQKIVWMVGGAQQSASLTLNPPDLGPLQVVLNVSNDQANATFISAQPEVRQAIEAALPKLREMMGEAGIQLGQTNINAGNGGQQGSSGEQNRPSPSSFAHGNDSVDTNGATHLASGTTTTRQGLVNTFA